MIHLTPMTAESLQALIADRNIHSFTQLASELGYKNKISGSLVKRFRTILPNVDDLLKSQTANSSAKDKPAVAAVEKPLELTLETLKKNHIRRVLDDCKPKNMDEIFKALDFKGTMEELEGKVRFWYPSIDWMMGEFAGTNKPHEPRQPKQSKPPKEKQAKIPEPRQPKSAKPVIDKPENPTLINPYRPQSAYALGFEVLYRRALKKLVNRAELITEYAQEAHISEKKAGFNMAVVLSPKSDGTCHQSARRASDVYWVKRGEDRAFVQLILRGKPKSKAAEKDPQ